MADPPETPSTVTATASPPDPDVIVKPAPDAITQFESPWGAHLLRIPPLEGTTTEASPEEFKKANDDFAEAQKTFKTALADWTAKKKEWEKTHPKTEKFPDPKPDAPKKPFHEHTWQASGCHPTSIAIVIRWMQAGFEKTKGKIVVAGQTAPTTVDPLTMTKWVLDPGGTPAKNYEGRGDGEHTPFVPKTAKFEIDHGKLTSTVGDKVTFQADPAKPPEALVKKSTSFTATMTAADRRRLLKEALLRGPVPLNMTKPGHFVLLYGYVGNTMFICDPGKVLFNSWAKKSPVDGKIDKDGPVVTVFETIGDEGNSCRLKIHDSFDFTGKGKFIDCLIYFESFHFASLGDQVDWKVAPAPAPTPTP